jgi:PAS domain S-box-containing protein
MQGLRKNATFEKTDSLTMKALSIKTRLFIYSMLFCFVGLLLLGGYSYYIARSALLERTFNQLTSIREEKAKQVEQFFSDRIRETQLISTDNTIAKLANQLETTGNIDLVTLKNNQPFSNTLSFLQAANCYSSITIGQPNGNAFCIKLSEKNPLSHIVHTTLSTKAELNSLAVKTSKNQQIEVSDFTTGSLINTYSSFICAPIANGSLAGSVVLLEIPDVAMNKLMAENIDKMEVGRSGEVYLAGDDFLMRSSSRFVDNSVLAVKSHTFAVEQSLMGFAGTAKIKDYRGVQVLSSYSPVDIPALRWVVVAEMDWNEALSDVVLLKKRILLIGAIIFLLITGGVFLFSSRITTPLIKLKEAATRVSEGNFDWIVPIPQRDEIGLLTQVFNKMTLSLKHTTQRLKEREHRLLHFYRATIDGILIHKSGKTILVNRAMINLTGYTEDQLLNTSPQSLFADDDYLLKYRDKNEVQSFEAILLAKNRQRVPVEVQHRKISFHNQDVEVMVIRNIAERKAMEDELKTERLHRLRSVIDGQEQERQRLSRELHDGLGQTLVAIKLRLESIALDKLGDQRKTIEMVKQMFNQTIEETRRISNNLMPAALTEFSLAVVLRNLCNEVESNAQINISLVVGVLPESIDMLTKTYSYRIVQEALTNIVKHSKATKAIVSVFSDIHKLFIHIEDNGIGYNKSQTNGTGNGLYNMKERATLLNGKFEIVSSAGKGTLVKVELPIKNFNPKHEN